MTLEALNKLGRIARNSGEVIEPGEARQLLRSYERMSLACQRFPVEDDMLYDILAQFATGTRLIAWLEKASATPEGRRVARGSRRTKRA
jgi:hypothetical protein